MLEYDLDMPVRDIQGMWGGCIIPYKTPEGFKPFTLYPEAHTSRLLALRTYSTSIGTESQVLNVSREEFFKNALLHSPSSCLVETKHGTSHRLWHWSPGIPSTGRERGIILAALRARPIDLSTLTTDKKVRVNINNLVDKILIEGILNAPPVSPADAVEKILTTKVKDNFALLDRYSAIIKRGDEYKLMFLSECVGELVFGESGTVYLKSTTDGLSNTALVHTLAPLLRQSPRIKEVLSFDDAKE